MDFAFTDEQEALRELARKILADHASHERLKEIEKGPDRFDQQLWGALARASLLGVALPAEVGGSGLGLVELALLLEEVGRAVAPIPVWPTLVLGALPLAEFGSPTQRTRWLPPVAAGEALLTAALVETASEDPAAPVTSARREGDGWRLDGTKICVPAAHLAARVLVPARGDGGVTVFLVDPKASGVELARQTTTTGEPQFVLGLHAVRVGDDEVLGPPAGGAAIVDWIVARALAGLSVMQVGVAARALEMTAQYASTREQFGKPIGTFQAVAQRAADAYIDVEAMRWTAWQAISRLAAGEPAAEEVAIAKFWAADGGHRVTYAAQHLHGGIGLDLDYPVHRYYLWAKEIELTLGSASRQLLRLGAALG
jgi:hypothetical protein